MKTKIKIVLNLLIAVIVPAAWLFMVFRGGGTLSTRGIWSLKYFTVLSNLYAALSALLWLIYRNKLTPAIRFMKFSSAIAVLVTFMVVLCFLGPLFGFGGMYVRSNFWFHLMIPVLCVLEAVFLPDEEPGVKQAALSLVPLVLYGVGYLINILVNGMKGNDWYAFFRNGYPAGLLMFAFLCLVTFLLAWLLARVSRFFLKKQ